MTKIYTGGLHLKILSQLIFILSATWLVACGAALPPENTDSHTHLVHVVSNGWHTAIVMPAPALVANGIIPELTDFPDAAFLEFGWGDRDYYQAKEKTLGITLAAVLAPTPAVMHIAAFQAPPKDNDRGLEVLSVGLTESGFQSLIQAIAAEFERPSGGRTESVSRGLYSDSYFYHAKGEFHLFNTCNTWTARMLRAGGVPLSSSGIVTADGLMDRLRTTLDIE